MEQKKSYEINVPRRVKKILQILQEAGHEACIVGGCVRDALLNRTPGDWDITTSALPSEVKSLFYNTVDTGIQHGTVMVVLEKEGFEVTTYRKDGVYSDCRHPDEVEFTPSLAEDLKRRDFTINALAYNDKDGIVDLFNGVGDLEKGIIRCVGDPDKRFSEDALRIMRAIRFAAQLSFVIEPATYQAIKNHADNLRAVSMERIRVEFEKTLLSDHPEYVNEYEKTGLAACVVGQEAAERCFPENSLSLYREILKRYGQDAEKKKILLLAAFFQNLSAEEAGKVCRHLKYDNRTRLLVTAVLTHKDEPFLPDRRILKKVLNRIGPEIMELVLDWKSVAMAADSTLLFGEMRCFEMREETALEDVKELYEEILQSGEAYTVSMLDISGADLIAAGIPEGPEIGRILEKLLEAVIEDPGCNRKEWFLSKIQNS